MCRRRAGALDAETRTTLIPVWEPWISTKNYDKRRRPTTDDDVMAEDARETTPLLRAEEVDKMEVYPIIHAIRADIMVSENSGSIKHASQYQ